jgi:DGQHR domain-containing protein
MELKNFFEIDISEIKQFSENTSIYIGKLTFKKLLEIYRLTERPENPIDPFNRKNINANLQSDEEFQRHLSMNKIQSIKQYLHRYLIDEKLKDKKGLGLFHTSLILALKHNYLYEPEKVDYSFLEKIYGRDNSLNSCFLNKDNTKLFIPRNFGICLIVDGQHRFWGLNQLYKSLEDEGKKKLIEDFELQVTFLIGLDSYELAQVFATVNFKQKPVNRSLYYDIFGSIPDEKGRNELKLAHDLALHLNNNANSPIKDMIRMLGKPPGLFSQSFFVEYIMPHFKEGKVWENLYEDYLNHGQEYLEIPKFMKIYLESIQEIYNFAWPVPLREEENKLIYSPFKGKYDYILCKTTGLGAFFKLIEDIYPLTTHLEYEQKKEVIKSILKRISKKEAKNYFKSSGDFGQTGGAGNVLKLYKLLKIKFKLTNN